MQERIAEWLEGIDLEVDDVAVRMALHDVSSEDKDFMWALARHLADKGWYGAATEALFEFYKTNS